MANDSWGDEPKNRAKVLLEKLLSHADVQESRPRAEFEKQKFKCEWNKVKDKQPDQVGPDYQFSVKTTTRDLLNFITDFDYSKERQWNTNNVSQAIRQIEKTIMGKKTNRKGQTNWQIELNLWFDKSNNKRNVERFCQEWDTISPTTGSRIEQATSKTNDQESIHDELIELLNTELAQNNDLLIEILKLLQNYFMDKDERNNNLLRKKVEGLLEIYLYAELENMLKSKNWEEADQVTSDIIWKQAGTAQERSFRAEVSRKFPCEVLRTIDALWTKYSDGHFGFSVQSRIWQSREVNRDLIKFMEGVGWGKLEKQEDGKSILFFLPADYSRLSEGQLPWFVTWEGSDGIRDRTAYIYKIDLSEI